MTFHEFPNFVAVRRALRSALRSALRRVPPRPIRWQRQHDLCRWSGASPVAVETLIFYHLFQELMLTKITKDDM